MVAERVKPPGLPTRLSAGIPPASVVIPGHTVSGAVRLTF